MGRRINRTKIDVMKALRVILYMIIWIFIALGLNFSIWTKFDYNVFNTAAFILNSTMAGIFATITADAFYKWFKSHLK